jgi:hypothetical protein
MPSFFTSDEAFEARDAGAPIMLDNDAVRAVLEYHDCGEESECFNQCRAAVVDGATRWDAAEILDFLGY